MIYDRQISFKLEGAAIKSQSVPFKLLASVLDGIQHTFYCIGQEVSGREPRNRGRLPADIQQACELRRVLERPGSYEVVAEVAADWQPDLFDFDIGKKALDKYMSLITYLGDNPDNSDIKTLFPDSTHRRRILRSVEMYCPREGDEWVLAFENTSMQRKSEITKNVRDKISKLINPPDIELLTVTGELMRLHLDEHKIAILYPATHRILECFYDKEIEDFIIGNLKGMIQVTGRVQLDSDGHPEKIIDVTAINELDLSSVKLSNISAFDTTLELVSPMVIEPSFDDQEVILEYPAFHIIASGETRGQAIRVFEEDFIWLWKEYAQASDNELTADAIQLKNDLLSMIKGGDSGDI